MGVRRPVSPGGYWRGEGAGGGKWAQYRETWFSEEYIAVCLEEYERELTESGALEREYFRWEGCAQGADAEDLYGIAVRRLQFLDGLFYSEDYWEYLS